MNILRARVVVTMTGDPIADGAVVISGKTVEAVGPWQIIAPQYHGAVEDLGDSILMPGLINAHCHLDYTILRGAIPPERSFAAWVGRINAAKRGLTESDILRSIAEGYAELRQWGTTTVCNLEAYTFETLPPAPVRTWWLPELIDVRDPSHRVEEEVLERFRDVPHLGLCPHAPYTASPDLYRRVARIAHEKGLLLSTHLAESADEEAMFARREGPLFEFLQGIGRPMDDCGRHSSFGNAVRNGLVGPGWLLAHVNELTEADFEWIATHPGPWRIVHCPLSHSWFGHRPFPWQRLHQLGVEVSLGTDSLASNQNLNLFAEMRQARRANPWITSEHLVKSVTTLPAKALGMSGKLGVVAPGAYADLIALPYRGEGPVYDAIVANPNSIQWLMLEGNRC